MCHECVNEICDQILELAEKYKETKQMWCLIAILKGLEALQTKLAETLMAEVITGKDYIKLIDLDRLDQISNLLEALDINEEIEQLDNIKSGVYDFV